MKILVILGQTAVGKSAWAVKLAQLYKGEVVSADSRQVYKRLNIGTGKITAAEMQGVPHHLLDIVEVGDARYSVANWKKDAEKVIEEISDRGNLPIICGGTGFYIDALVQNKNYSEERVEISPELKAMSTPELFTHLQKLDPARASTIDPHNRRRLERAISLAEAHGKVPTVTAQPRPDWQIKTIGLTLPDNILKERIIKRLDERLTGGMIDEVKNLLAEGVLPERLKELGLEYKYITLHLEGTLTAEELRTALINKIWQYARRQRTWWRKDSSIEWIDARDEKAILAAAANWSSANSGGR
jgi:tRNA dimethylallyltransferase